jgi:hypothetical protein
MKMNTRTVTIPELTVTRRIAVVAVLLATALAACGSASPSAPGSSAPGAVTGPTPGSSQTSQASQPAQPSSEATDGTSGGSSGGGGQSGDIDALAKALVPPNSTEMTKTTATDTWFAMYQTTDSLDALKSFYEAAFPKAGLTVISTSSASGTLSWAIANAGGGPFGGAVSIFPTGDGKNGVQVTIGKS